MSELSMYQQQLEQIDLALIDDPKNQELLTLKDDIADLINLMIMAAAPSASSTKQTSEKAKPSNSTSTASPPSPYPVAISITTTTPATETTTASPVLKTDWKVGDRCKAKWSVDGRFYDAQITAVGGPDNEMYSVTFTEYGNIELLRADALRTRGGNGSAQKRKSSEGEASWTGGGADAVAAKKKKKKGPPTKSEVVEKQNSWLAFAKKGPKGKNAVPVASKKSMFATPDNPNAKTIFFFHLVAATRRKRRWKS